MKKIYIKIILGFRRDQEFSIDAKEAHKAYYLFRNPTERGTFSTGLAITGSQIQRIEPDYNATMGWHPDYQLTGEDHEAIQAEGIDQKLRRIMSSANDIASHTIGKELELPLPEVLRMRGLLEYVNNTKQLNGDNKN